MRDNYAYIYKLYEHCYNAYNISVKLYAEYIYYSAMSNYYYTRPNNIVLNYCWLPW